MRLHCRKLFELLTVICIVFTSEAYAAVIYVHKDTTCPGEGTSTNPYCTIQHAFESVRPGDVVRIRNSATPYDERAVATISGTPTAPITVEPDVGHNPTLRLSRANAQEGAIEIRDADHWYIRGLTFNGNGTQTSRHAVLIYASTRDITGHRVAQNTFRNWGGTGENTKGAAALMLRPSYNNGFNNLHVQSAVIADNTFAYNATESIHLTKTTNTVVERNTIHNSLCGRGSDNTAIATAIKDSQGSVGNIIRNNLIRDHQMSEDCMLPNQGHATYAGIYCDTGPTRGEISGNIIFNIDNGRANNTNPRAIGVSSQGIIIESRCHDWSVRHNIVYNIGQYGLRNGSRNTGDPNRTVWTNNTVFGASRSPLFVARGYNLTIKNNILVHKQTTGIDVMSTAISQGPHTIDYNLYWDMNNGTRVGRWGDLADRNLADWRQSCGCDSKGISSDPLFINLSPGSEDLRLTSSSPARGAGEGRVDLGAYNSLALPMLSKLPAPTLNAVK